MTNQQLRIIESAVDKAIDAAKKALPNGTDEELTEAAMEHLPSFPPDIEQALAAEWRKELIRERARELGVTLQE